MCVWPWRLARHRRKRVCSCYNDTLLLYLVDVRRSALWRRGCLCVCYCAQTTDAIIMRPSPDWSHSSFPVPSVNELQRLVNICELELAALDMLINANKSCLRIRPRHRPNVDSIRYLGIYITRSVKFKCSLNNAKNVSINQVMLYLVKLEELHLRKLSCIL